MPSNNNNDYDAIVVGAGFGGMYMVHVLSQLGLNVLGYERGGDVGGTWYWNRYPGCQCDVESMEYSYQFSDDLQQEWEWTNRYASQAEILDYAAHVADRFNLREKFRFNAGVTSATWGDDDKRWHIEAENGDHVTAQYFIMATGCLSTTNIPNFPGLDAFKGPTYHTGGWPHEGVDFTGQRVAVIGTGSSGIQSIPLIAQQAAELTVFQRTPNYSIPARNMPLDPMLQQDIKANYTDFRARGYMQPAAFGADYPRHSDSVLDATPEEREARFEEYWQRGGFVFLGSFGDISINLEANEFAAEFVRGKIRAVVDDPAVAELLCPDTVLGCKRLCADNGYFETFNQPHVHLVDVSEHPIDHLTDKGLVTNGQEYEFDAIVFATGFDAMTGSLLKANITGAHAVPLREKWADGPGAYLGLMTAGFPNLFMITAPGSPSALANLITGVEQHAEFIGDLVTWAASAGHLVIEAEKTSEDDWMKIVAERGDASLYPYCNSWYVGANIPGKPRVFMPYIGFPDYVKKLQDVVDNSYEGLRFI